MERMWVILSDISPCLFYQLVVLWQVYILLGALMLAAPLRSHVPLARQLDL